MSRDFEIVFDGMKSRSEVLESQRADLDELWCTAFDYGGAEKEDAMDDSIDEARTAGYDDGFDEGLRLGTLNAQ